MAEMTYNITLTANHQSLTAEYLPLAAESVQYLTAKVVCETEDWTGREIKAMFGQGCTVYEVPVTGGEITAKQQLNLTAGDWRVWLVGNSARDGEVIPRITTNIAHISVAPTGGTEGNPFPIIPPTVAEQLRADMGNLADLTTEDKSSLVAAINEAAESGGSKDAVTYTPQTLTEEQQAQARTNIGALDVNIKTTPVDTDVTLFGRGESIVYVKDGWLKPCPTDADNELILHYRRVFGFIGLPYTEPNSQNILLEAKSAYALYQKGLASESIKVTNNPLRAAQVYVKWNLTTRSNKHYFYYAQVSTAYKYDCTYCVEDDALTSEIYQSAIYSTSTGVGEQDSVSQFRMYTNPTEDMHIATKKYVDTAKTEAQQLGITAAAPGQIIKVKTVQDGKPTEWEAVDMDAGKLPKFTKLLTHTITDDELAASPIAFIWGTAQIPNLNDFNVFALTIVRPDGAKIEFNKWVKLKINGTLLGNICGTSTAASPQYAITANRLFGVWISGNYYDPRNIGVPVLVPPGSSSTFQSGLPDSEPVTSIGFTSYVADYGLTAGIVVELWGAK